MATERLGEKNIDLLLNQYRSERKRLMFQLNKVRETIGELKTLRAKAAKAAPEATVKRGPGRPPKVRSEDGGSASAGRRRGRRKNARAGGYRLSPWDVMVVDAIKKEGLLPKEVIMEHARAWAKTHAKRMTIDEISVKVTRVLQKLSGPRGVLGTHRTGLRRGYHYGLKEWFFASSGALRKQYMDRLVLEPKA